MRGRYENVEFLLFLQLVEIPELTRLSSVNYSAPMVLRTYNGFLGK